MMSKFFRVFKNFEEIYRRLEKIQESIGNLENLQYQLKDSERLRENEFQVFSQNGEDGIIQFLLRHVPIQKRIFVEFGVENYTEANTRFLLKKDKWSGLIIDGSRKNVEFIRKDSIYWKHDLRAVHAFVTRENINSVLENNGIKGEIGLLSIDIDGNDYWVWEAIDIVNPVIVIIEYNHRFGDDRAVTIPYDPRFIRSTAHYSNIYYGASLKALCQLSTKKGYSFIGCNSTGNNAFFLRKDARPEFIRELTAEEGYIAGKFREARDKQGHLSFLTPEEEQTILKTLPLIEVAD